MSPMLKKAYASPGFWGPWTIVESHIGRITCTIEAWPEGNTTIFGEVKYWSKEGIRSVVPFRDQIRITTGNSIGNIEVRFRGIPFGSVVSISVS